MTEEKVGILPLIIFLISFYLLLLEIFLTRIFSVLLYYHFAFMAISIALLGLGSSGMIIYFFPNFFSKERSYKLIAWSFILFSLSTLLVLFAIISLKIELYITISSFFELAALYILLLFPFFFGGLIVSLILFHFSDKVSKLYFFDLVGAGLGTIAVIPLLKLIGGPNGLIFISLLGSLGALIISLYYKFKNVSIFSGTVVITTILLLLIGLIYNPFTLEFTKGNPDDYRNEKKEFSAWNAISRVDLFSRGENKYILIDSDAFTQVIKIDRNIEEAKEQIVDTINALPYHIKQNSSALIIGAGGGRDVIAALLFNNTVTGIEINDIIVDTLMKGSLRNFSGNLYFRNNVNVIVDEGRSYTKRSKEKFGIIQMSLVDTFAATAAGAFTLTENNLYTIEAFIDYLDHLKDDGIFTSTRFTFSKPQETIRLVGIALESLERIGIKNSEKNIMIVKTDLNITGKHRTPFEGVANVMIKKSVFTEKETSTIREKSKEQGFTILYDPYVVEDNLYNKLIRNQDRESFYETYELDITPTTDDRPFFFYTVKFKDSFNFLKLFSGQYEKELLLKTNLGLFILWVTFLLTFVLSFLFMLFPLILTKYKDLQTATKDKIIILFYFAGLGLGFILIEIVLIEKFILFLGHPVYSLGVALSSLLIFSGIGSYTTNSTSNEKSKKNILINLIFLSVIIIIYIFILNTIFNYLIDKQLFLRILISIILIMPIGLILGRFFPLGIKTIDQHYHNIIPWIWGINGTTSVVGSVIALILAINLGFNAVLIIGLLCYIPTLALIFKR